MPPARKSSLLKRPLILMLTLVSACSWVKPHPAASTADYPRDMSYTPATELAKQQQNFAPLRLANPTIPQNIQAWLDQPYKNLGKRILTLDVYAPEKRSRPLPVVVFVHGGGWKSGDKTMLAPLAFGVAQREFVTMSVSYRLSPEAIFPAGYEDVVDAMRWVKRHGAQYGGDTSRIAIAGTSAGGQLASLVAYSQAHLLTQNHGNSIDAVTVQALLNIDGLMDFTSEEALPFENDPAREITSASAWLGGKYEVNAEVWRRASAFYYVSSQSPPTLFLNSAHDRFHAGRDATVKQLKQWRIETQTQTLFDTPHTFWLFEQWLPQTIDHCTDFLNSVLSRRQ